MIKSGKYYIYIYIYFSCNSFIYSKFDWTPVLLWKHQAHGFLSVVPHVFKTYWIARNSSISLSFDWRLFQKSSGKDGWKLSTPKMADLASTPSKSVFKWENHPYLYLDPSIHPSIYLSIYLYIGWYWVIFQQKIVWLPNGNAKINQKRQDPYIATSPAPASAKIPRTSGLTAWHKKMVAMLMKKGEFNQQQLRLKLQTYGFQLSKIVVYPLVVEDCYGNYHSCIDKWSTNMPCSFAMLDCQRVIARRRFRVQQFWAAKCTWNIDTGLIDGLDVNSKYP